MQNYGGDGRHSVDQGARAADVDGIDNHNPHWDDNSHFTDPQQGVLPHPDSPDSSLQESRTCITRTQSGLLLELVDPAVMP